MKNIQLLQHPEFTNLSLYEAIEEGIYRKLDDTDDSCYRLALSYIEEEGDEDGYPMEDILDRYSLYISDFVEHALEGEAVILAGTLESLRNAKYIIGKHVYNRPFFGEDGREYVDLVIEE